MNCDKIVVLKNGTAVEMGTHDDLLNLNGEYKKMWDIQSADKKMDSGKEPKQNSVGIFLAVANPHKYEGVLVIIITC